MKKTFKSWLVANFETAIGGLISAIIGLFLIFSLFVMEFAQIDDAILYLLYSISFASVPWAVCTLAVGKAMYILLILAGILLHVYSGLPEFADFHAILRIAIPCYWGIFVVSNVISGFLARYAYLNFAEVVSRRMLWRKSKVTLFETRWKYALNRFVNIACTLMFCLGLFAGFIILILYNKEVEKVLSVLTK
jgi:hypothetical protein